MTSTISEAAGYVRLASCSPVPGWLARTERLVKERMTLFDVNIDGMTPQKLINPKAFAVIRDFFGRSQLASSWIRPTCGADS